MYKQTVTYEDFNGNTQTETLYFNVTKTELTENLDLADQVQSVQGIFEGGERELTTPEIQRILNLVKTLIKMSYGVRSEDGKRFHKDDGLWRDFTQTAVYDAFLFSLFEDPQKASAFMTGIMPKDLIEQAQNQANQFQIPMETASLPPKEEIPPRLEELSKEELIEMARRNT